MSTEVLLVDDEEPIARVLARSLQARGYTVRVALNGEDALETLAERAPDVMLLDVNLPDLTGWEVLRRLGRARRERVPVIVFSASPLAPQRVQEFAPEGVLVKPFPIEALLRLVREIADRTPRRETANG